MQILTTQNVQYLDTQNRSCSNGYIYVLDVKNLTELDVYTLTDSQYVKAANPIRLDLNGRPNQTYFTESLAYCRLYDAHDQFIREWYGSSNVDPVINDTIVYTVANLRKAALTLGSVTVVGYWNESDCEARTYTWQAECNTSDDDGLVIKSDLSESGRWLLVTDRVYIPSTYYGVYPGHEENIQKFLARANTVYDQSYPTCNFFVSGKYETAAGLATLHPVLLDRGVSFAANYMSAPSFKLVGKQTSDTAIGNLKSRAAVYSSWYTSLDTFFASGSMDMTIDTVKAMTQDVELKSVTLHGAMDNTSTWTGKLTLNSCKVDDGLFYGFETVKFTNMDVCDRYFQKLTSLNNIEGTSVAQLKDWNSPSLYVTAVETYTPSVTELYLQGRPLTATHTFTTATAIHGLVTSYGVTFSKSCNIYDSDIKYLNAANTLTVKDSYIGQIESQAAANISLLNCTCDTYLSNIYVETLYLTNSSIGAGSIDTSYTQLFASDSVIGADLTTSVITDSIYVHARNTNFAGQTVLAHADLDCCSLTSVTVKPYSANHLRHMDLRVVNCAISTMTWDNTWQQNTLTLDLTNTSITQTTLAPAGTSDDPYFKSAIVMNGDRIHGAVLKKSDFTLDDADTTATSKTVVAYTNYTTPGTVKRLDTVTTPLLASTDGSLTYLTNATVSFATDTTWSYVVNITKATYDEMQELTLI